MTRRLLLAFLVCVLVACVTAACATVVEVVKPSNMNGWVAGSQAPGMQLLRDPAPPNRYGELEHSGTGAWYAFTGMADSSNPVQGNCWIGTNRYAGVRLSNIQTMKYLSWTDDSGIWMNKTGPGTYRGRQLNSSRHCVVLNLVIDLDPDNHPGDPAYQRYLMLRPFGTKNQGMPGSSCERFFGGMYRHWWQADGMSHKWLEIYPTDTMNIWDWVPGIDNGCQAWADILAAHPNAAIAASVAEGNVWPGNSNVLDTPNGCVLNFMYGAEHRSGNTNINPAHPLANAWNNWWRDAQGMRAYMDNFLMQVDLNGDGDIEDEGEDILYDFEADEPARVVAITTRGARDREACGVPSVHGPEFGAEHYSYVLCGVVAGPDENGKFGPGLHSFYVDDGYMKTEVVCPGHDFNTPGIWVRVKGMLNIDYGQFLDTDTSDEYNAGDPAPVLTWEPVVYGNLPRIHPRLLCTLDDIQILYEAPM